MDQINHNQNGKVDQNNIRLQDDHCKATEFINADNRVLRTQPLLVSKFLEANFII